MWRRTARRAPAAHGLSQAAKCTEAPAQYHLGDLFPHGEGLLVDELKTRTWFQKAALQGPGPMLAAGQGTSKDLGCCLLSLEKDDRAAALLQILDGQITADKSHQQSGVLELRLAELRVAKN